MTLLDIAEKHRGAIEYDWRNRLHVGFDAVPAQMDWAEAWRLLRVLLSDPSTYISTALAGWEHPISREDMTMRDLYDLQHRAKAKRRPKPYSRPWLVDSRRHGRGPGVTIAQFKAIKARLMGK